MGATYSYSLIRAVPDRRRGEWINVGLVVYWPDHLDVHVLPTHTKLRMLAPSVDGTLLESLQCDWSLLCEGIEGIGERQRLLSRLPFLHASPLANFVATATTYRAAIDSIMRDLVFPPPQPRREPRTSGVQVTLREHFEHAQIFARDPGEIHRHKVVQHFPIDAGSGLTADFALQNGKMRFTETVDFRVKEDQFAQKRHQVGTKAVTLDRATKRFPNCQTFVVYAARPESLPLIQPSLSLLADYADQLIDMNNEGDLQRYLSTMRLAAAGPTDTPPRLLQ